MCIIKSKIAPITTKMILFLILGQRDDTKCSSPHQQDIYLDFYYILNRSNWNLSCYYTAVKHPPQRTKPKRRRSAGRTPGSSTPSLLTRDASLATLGRTTSTTRTAALTTAYAATARASLRSAAAAPATRAAGPASLRASEAASASAASSAPARKASSAREAAARSAPVKAQP
jgi:hypothetical protein